MSAPKKKPAVFMPQPLRSDASIAVDKLLQTLGPLSPEARLRVIRSIVTFFDLNVEIRR